MIGDRRSDKTIISQSSWVKTPRLGVRWGLLINPQRQQVELYRPGQEPQVLVSPTAINCSEVMPGCVLDLNRIW
jgi:Uma2 family endonuclease